MNRAQRRKAEKAIRRLVTDRCSHHSTEETPSGIGMRRDQDLPLTAGGQLKNSPSRAACSPIRRRKNAAPRNQES